jgi:hypothetical protein
MEFIAQQRAEDPWVTPEQPVQAVQKPFQLQVHPRSIAWRLQQEKTAPKPTVTNSPEALRSAYEDLRVQVFAGRGGPGLALFLRDGMCEWLEVCGPAIAVVATREPAERTRNLQTVPPEMRSEIVSMHDADQKVKASHLARSSPHHHPPKRQRGRTHAARQNVTESKRCDLQYDFLRGCDEP